VPIDEAEALQWLDEGRRPENKNYQNIEADFTETRMNYRIYLCLIES